MTWPTKKIKEAEDKSKNIRIFFEILAGRNAHIVTIVIVGHLLVEYLLEKIILEKIGRSKNILGKRFSEKLELLYPTWLPFFIYENAKLLNNIRNDIAHNLGAIDYKPIIYPPRGKEEVVNIPKKKNAGKFYFRYLINTILFDLANYSYCTLGISADLDYHRIFRLNKK